jgi:peroxiredoxin
MSIRKGSTSIARETATLKVGDEAPDFSLKSHLGDKSRLRDVRGKKNVVMVFFPLAFTPV